MPQVLFKFWNVSEKWRKEKIHAGQVGFERQNLPCHSVAPQITRPPRPHGLVHSSLKRDYFVENEIKKLHNFVFFKLAFKSLADSQLPGTEKKTFSNSSFKQIQLSFLPCLQSCSHLWSQYYNKCLVVFFTQEIPAVKIICAWKMAVTTIITLSLEKIGKTQTSLVLVQKWSKYWTPGANGFNLHMRIST